MNARLVLIAAFVGVVVTGCGATPVASYSSDLELNDRPGLFSGETGAFVLRVGGARKEVSRSSDVSAQPGDYEAFERWKKGSATSDQHDFQEWLEWRKYQEWKKQQGR